MKTLAKRWIAGPCLLREAAGDELGQASLAGIMGGALLKARLGDRPVGSALEPQLPGRG
ncbi:hypothetical protein [Roseateles sp. LKC17W]|uniref:Uncharacterized protein n=1 Tax=Pelomonas margarita TaxID=3299031 RepID=A0ABW7FK86_9BURK